MSRIIGSSKISKKGQLTIPKNIRGELGLNEGDIVLFIKEDNNIKIKRGKLKVEE